jgi:hypothetical protein
MNRAAAKALLTQKYRELATEAEFTTQQTTDAFDAALDMSLRQLGYEETALATADVPQADVMKYIALINYYTLDRFVLLFSINTDLKAGSGAIDISESQIFKQVGALKMQAAAELSMYGIDVGGSGGGYQMGRINLDFLEPSTITEF